MQCSITTKLLNAYNAEIPNTSDTVNLMTSSLKVSLSTFLDDKGYNSFIGLFDIYRVNPVFVLVLFLNYIFKQ